MSFCCVAMVNYIVYTHVIRHRAPEAAHNTHQPTHPPTREVVHPHKRRQVEGVVGGGVRGRVAQVHLGQIRQRQPALQRDGRRVHALLHAGPPERLRAQQLAPAVPGGRLVIHEAERQLLCAGEVP